MPKTPTKAAAIILGVITVLQGGESRAEWGWRSKISSGEDLWVGVGEKCTVQTADNIGRIVFLDHERQIDL